jgi:hypothetical protein
MSGSLTEAQAKWLQDFTGVDVSALVHSSSVSAAPSNAPKAKATI